MKLGFVTCVKLGLSCMEAIYRAGGELAFAMTLPDDHACTKSGRVYIDDFCTKNGIPLLKSSNVNNPDVVEAIKMAGLDWLFIVGWSQIATDQVLKASLRGVLGMHPTLLPEGRGRAAIPWAILRELPKTGVTLFKMDAGVDAGPIAMQVEITLSPTTSATKLYEQVDSAHIELINKAIPLIYSDGLTLQEQDHSAATVWLGRKPEDGKIDLAGSIYEAERLIRAVTHPYPGAYYDFDNIRHIVWAAEIAQVGAILQGSYLRFSDGILIIKDYSIRPIIGS